MHFMLIHATVDHATPVDPCASQACLEAASSRVMALEDDLDAAQTKRDELAAQLATVEGDLAAERARARATEDDLQAEVSRLSAEVARAAGAVNATKELREKAMQHKQEAAKLRQEKVQAERRARAGGAGGAGGKELDLAKKEAERLREQLRRAEERARALVQEKSEAVGAKGQAERELKALQAKHAAATRQLERRDAAEAKRLEALRGEVEALRRAKEEAAEAAAAGAAREDTLRAEVAEAVGRAEAEAGRARAAEDEGTRRQEEAGRAREEAEERARRLADAEREGSETRAALEEVRGCAHPCTGYSMFSHTTLARTQRRHVALHVPSRLRHSLQARGTLSAKEAALESTLASLRDATAKAEALSQRVTELEGSLSLQERRATEAEAQLAEIPALQQASCC